MKKGFSLTALAFFVFLGNTMAFAQAGLKKANKKYDQWSYTQAATIYDKVFTRGFSNADMLQKLGNAHFFNARYAQAHTFYEQLFTQFNSNEIAAEYYYRYAQTLLHLGNNTDAKKYFELFVQKTENNVQLQNSIVNNEAQRKQITENSGRYDAVTNLASNSAFADYGSFVNNANLYFTSARDTGSFAKNIHTWTNAAFTKLYTINLAENKKPKKVSGKVNSKLNQASAIVTANGKTMYFTRNNMINGKRGYDSAKATRLKIYKAELVDDTWQNITELPFNADDFNTAHPALSADERTLYFVSDREGGFGDADLWKVSINGNNYGVPVNLGAHINTAGKETFPFVNSNNELYFASDARFGLGGLDIYAVKIKDDGSFYDVQNVGEPVNSNFDDFAYYIDYTTKAGFFSSNRKGGKGNDDIYSFIETKSLKLGCSQDLSVTVIDAKTQNIIPDVSLELFNANNQQIASTNKFTNSGYRFNTDYVCGDTYQIKATKEGYINSTETVTLNKTSGVTEYKLVLHPKKVEVKKNDDLFKVLKLKPIYFDYDKDHIRPDAAIELAKVVEVLKDYPRMKIDVRSHTDSRGSDVYNEKLSQRRAKSTALWIINQGIDAARVTYKGYGETQLMNDCKNGVKCTDEKHEENRRSEFIVLEL